VDVLTGNDSGNGLQQLFDDSMGKMQVCGDEGCECGDNR